MNHDGPEPIVQRLDESTLVDRRSLAKLTGRSVHTIRLRCPVHSYSDDGRALYDSERAEKILNNIATRKPRGSRRR